MIERTGHRHDPPRAAHQTERFAGYARLALAAAVPSALLLFVVAGLLRVWLPLPVDIHELALVAHVGRLTHGLPVYAPPSVHFVSLIYMPLFYYASALVELIVGEGFVGLRLVSLASSLVSIWLVYRIVRLESGSREAGFVAAGLRAALGGDLGWLALARVDGLMNCFVVAALYRMRVANGRLGIAAAGALFGLATLTKQSAFLMWVPMAIWQTWSDRRRGAFFVTGFVMTVVTVGTVLEWQTSGWFSDHTVYVAAYQHAGSALGALQALTDVLRRVPFAILMPMLLLLPSIRTRLDIDPDTAAFYVAGVVATVGAAFTTELLHASVSNILLLPCLWFLILFVICAERLVRFARQHVDPDLELIVLTVCLVQFVSLTYVPSKLVPGVDDPVTIGTTLVTFSGNGRVESTTAPRVHQSSLDPVEYADGFAVVDLQTAASPAVWHGFESTVRSAICQATVSRSVVLDGIVVDLFGGDAALSASSRCPPPPVPPDRAH